MSKPVNISVVLDDGTIQSYDRGIYMNAHVDENGVASGTWVALGLDRLQVMGMYKQLCYKMVNVYKIKPEAMIANLADVVPMEAIERMLEDYE